jgi:hypothetical protein
MLQIPFETRLYRYINAKMRFLLLPGASATTLVIARMHASILQLILTIYPTPTSICVNSTGRVTRTRTLRVFGSLYSLHMRLVSILRKISRSLNFYGEKESVQSTGMFVRERSIKAPLLRFTCMPLSTGITRGKMASIITKRICSSLQNLCVVH